MIARSAASIPLNAVRIGRTDVGAAVATIDDEAMIIVISGDGHDRPLRIRFDVIESIHRAGDDVELTLRDATRVILACANAAALQDQLIGSCRTVPELTRTLRAFGSRRGRQSARDSASTEQQRFFAPLIDARRNALGATPAESIASFNGTALLAAYDETLRRFASERYVQPGPARRALEAELEDLAEPMFAALRLLGETGETAATNPDDLRVWRAWSAQLRATFEIADRVWLALDAALDTP